MLSSSRKHTDQDWELFLTKKKTTSQTTDVFHKSNKSQIVVEAVNKKGKKVQSNAPALPKRVSVSSDGQSSSAEEVDLSGDRLILPEDDNDEDIDDEELGEEEEAGSESDFLDEEAAEVGDDDITDEGSEMDDDGIDDEDEVDSDVDEDANSDVDDGKPYMLGEDGEDEEDSDDVEDEEEDENDEEALLNKFLTEDVDVNEKDANVKYKDYFVESKSDKKGNKMQSKFEMSQDQLQKEIDKLEEVMMDEKKPWRLRGEIEAVDRPENALLEEDLEVNYVGVNKPTVSEEIEKGLEDLIKEKIKGRTFDDVERKTKRGPEDLFAYRKRLEANTEKPKPLHEIYEEDFQRKEKLIKEEQDDPAKEAIRKEMTNLFRKLDALSSLHFVPKAPLPEVKLVTHTAAVMVEEAAPTTLSVADTLAPEEILPHRLAPLMGKSEMDAADKRKKRRKTKERYSSIKKARIDTGEEKPDSRRLGKRKDAAMAKVVKMAHKPKSNIKIVT